MNDALVSDFDGTMTRNDFYLLIARSYIPPDGPAYFAEYRAGRMSHFEAMAAYFSHLPVNAAAIDSLLREVDADPALGAAAARLAEASWDLIVVSAGSAWYIDRILATAGVRATVHANPGRVEPGRGLVLEKPRSSPFFSDETGIDKAAVVRDAIGRHRQVAFAGDGPPDVAPALLVAPHLRFARGYLAQELRRRGEAFREFARWSDVVDALV